MAPITTASDETNHMALLDKLDMHKIHKPFRSPNWKPPQRRNKTLKQIVSETQRKEQSLLATQNNSGATTPQSGEAQSNNNTSTINATHLSRAVLEKNQKQAASQLHPPSVAPSYTYTSVAAAPSFKPKQRYCDITGLPAPYQDPKSGLRYHNKEIYSVVKTLSTTQVQEYLAARGANTVLK